MTHQTSAKTPALYPVIETERLLLRMFRADDLDAVYRLFSDSEVQKYLAPENRRTREQLVSTLINLVKRWDERGFGLWAVTDKESDEFIGYCGFQYFDKSPAIEIVFALSQEFWGHGFATEAAKACLKFWFDEISFDNILAVTNPNNTASQKVLEKIGMCFEEKSVHYNMDLVVYSLSRKKYRAEESYYKLNRLDFKQTSLPGLQSPINSFPF